MQLAGTFCLIGMVFLIFFFLMPLYQISVLQFDMVPDILYSLILSNIYIIY